VIRAATPADAEAIAAVYAPYVLETAVSFEEVPPTAGEMAARMLPGMPWLVATDSQSVVGFAYASPHHSRPAYRWGVDVSVYLDASVRGRGLGRALYAALLPVVTRMGYVRAYAGVTLPNDASVGLHEAMGFTAVGVYREAGFKLGQWRDVGWWQLALMSPSQDIADPLPWDGEL
jgi:L-amino acid N-acyltransferase YncA